MMASLNEYCIQHINTFLQPHDWIHVSRVCKLWNSATSRSWKTITVIKNWDYWYNIPENKASFVKDNEMPNMPIKVSTVDVGKILLAAAPFVKVLDLIPDNVDKVMMAPTNNEMYLIQIGEILYQVPDFELKNVLKLVTKKSTELTTICIRHPPEIDVMKTLFKNNNITKLELEDDWRNTGTGWYHNVQTSTIEELRMRFDFDEFTDHDFKSFQGLFPHLKKLDLTIWSQTGEDAETILSQILAYVPALKTLRLCIFPDLDEGFTDNLEKLFSEVIKLSELEKFSLEFDKFKSPDLFLNQLSKCCPKLRDLKFNVGIQVNKESLITLLSLPRLQNFKFRWITLIDGFSHIELPALKYLSKLDIECTLNDREYVPELTELTGFFEIVKNSPLLEQIEIRLFSSASEDTLIDFVCGIVEAATSLSKDVFVKPYYPKTISKNFRVAKVNRLEEDENSSQSSKTLQLVFFHEYNNDKRLIEGVEKFVRNKLYHYKVFMSNAKKQKTKK